MLHKFVANVIDKNVQRQKCAYARLPKATKLCKARMGHFFVDIVFFHIFVEIYEKRVINSIDIINNILQNFTLL